MLVFKGQELLMVLGHLNELVKIKKFHIFIRLNTYGMGYFQNSLKQFIRYIFWPKYCLWVLLWVNGPFLHRTTKQVKKFPSECRKNAVKEATPCKSSLSFLPVVNRYRIEPTSASNWFNNHSWRVEQILLVLSWQFLTQKVRKNYRII